MTNRRRFTYTVTLGKPDGTMGTVAYTVLWSPEKVTSQEVAEAAAAEYSAGKAGPHAGISAVLVNE